MPYFSSTEPTILLVGCITQKNISIDIPSYFEEFRSLVESNGIQTFLFHEVKLREISPATFLTKGKLEELKKICIDKEIEEVIFSEKLTPHQEMRLEKILGINVYDRTHLILEIFEKQARTDEAKIQVKIAFLKHKKTRLSGRGSHFSQQSGRKGALSGAGETQKELDLQHIDHLLEKLKRELKQIENTFSEQRKKRIRNNVFSISIVGYTNAGKSTLFNLLTQASVLAQDKLFATLDTTTRKLFLGDDIKRSVTLSDTVGFIESLPYELIASFRSTLSEINYSSLILVTLDISNRNWRRHKKIVLDTLAGLLTQEISLFFIYNKIDLVAEEEKKILEEELHSFEEEFFLISAKDKQSVTDLLNAVKERVVN